MQSLLTLPSPSNMLKKSTTIFVFLFSTIFCFSQFTPGVSYFGTNNYIEYIAGNLPVIISVAHGGNQNPGNIPDRMCNNPTTITDLNTNELALEIDTAFVNLFGCHPHTILTHLSRKKIDNNRDIIDGACGNADAELAWTEFHNYIDTAAKYVNLKYGKGFYIDLHGHGHAIQRLELGYLLTGANYDLSDDELNAQLYIDKSSLKKLVSTNIQALTHAQLLRGDFALGTLLMNGGYPSVPSKLIPSPNGDPYFDGGYNTENYTSVVGGTIDGVQIECNMTGVRDTKANRKKFADSLAAALKIILIQHYGLQTSLQNCQIVLPVKISYFNLFWNSFTQQVDIQWQTTGEINNHYFEVLRSVNAKDFIVIGKVMAKNNNESTANYNAIDINPPAGEVYYKLRQYDKDNNFNEFEIKHITIKAKPQTTKVDPVCNNNQINIYLPEKEKLPLQAMLFSMNGKNVGSFLLQKNGLNQIDVGALPSGIYTLKLCQNQSVSAFKIIKL